MKKQNFMLVVLMAIVTLTTIDAKAQTKVWSIGPEAGISFSKYGKDASSNSFKPGAVAGLFVTYSIINNFGVSAKFLIHQKGASFESNDTKQTLTYFEIPIVGRYFFNKEGKVRPNIFLGPSFSFLTGVKNKDGSNNPEKIDYKNDYNTVDVGVTTGFGCNIRIQDETYLVLDGRYTHGLSDLSKSNNNNVNNQSLAFTAGVSFGF